MRKTKAKATDARARAGDNKNHYAGVPVLPNGGYPHAGAWIRRLLERKNRGGSLTYGTARELGRALGEAIGIKSSIHETTISALRHDRRTPSAGMVFGIMVLSKISYKVYAKGPK